MLAINPMMPKNTVRLNSCIYHKPRVKHKKSESKSLYNPNCYYPLSLNKKSTKAVSFLGYNVHIVDGGNHATNMQHFAKAISDDMDIEMHNVEVNSKDPLIKQLKSLEQELKEINNNNSNLNGEYVAIPALASVSLLNIQDQFNRVMKQDKKFTPENIKANKKKLLAFLKELYDYSGYYKEYIGYMDPNKQGIEYTYGVIQEINKLKRKGAKVYVPSGHPQDETLKWLAKERGLKPELYNYIATGYDKDNKITKMHKEIKDNNWYDFNLLSLSDANIVGVKGTSGAQDYMFAAYDSCITDGARGVYNFSPVRKDGELVGYSYTDTYTNEYPYEEFPANDEISNLVKFVGKDLNEVLASNKETKEFKTAIKNYDTSQCADKLYSVYEVFSKEKIENNKIELQGDYVDKSLRLFFRKNDDGKAIFQKCDCEGSGKPSVLSMWGSCFSVFNAIERDIDLQNKHDYKGSEKVVNTFHMGRPKFTDYREAYFDDYDYNNTEYNNSLNIAKNSLNKKDIEAALKHYKKAYLIAKDGVGKNHPITQSLCSKIGDLFSNQNNYEEAENYYNKALKESYRLTSSQKAGNALLFHKIGNMCKLQSKDEEAKQCYNKALNLYSELSLKIKQHLFGFYSYYIDQFKKSTSDLFIQLANICKQNGELYPAEVCKQAAKEIKNQTDIGDKIIERRADGVEYIGDLFPNIKPY